jgi:hypothetical protein
MLEAETLLATAYCRQALTCNCTGFFTNEADCVAAAMAPYARSPSATFDNDCLSRTLAAVPSYGCDSLGVLQQKGALVTCRVFGGEIRAGESCYFFSEDCEPALFCSTTHGDTCQPAKLGALGASCSDDTVRCAPSLFCDADFTCKERLGAGASCKPEDGGMVWSGTCATGLTCVPPLYACQLLKAVGDTCDSNDALLCPGLCVNGKCAAGDAYLCRMLTQP